MKMYSVKILSLFTVLMMALSPAFASQNVISSIVISKSKEKPGIYELNIDSTQSTQYKTTIEQDGSVYFDLKNSVLTQNTGTIYDDASDIENVSVKQLEKNKVRIYVKGKNAKNTELIFVNSLFEPQNQKKIIINRPISQYKPTASYDDLDSQTDIQDWDDNSFNFKHLLTETIINLKDGVGGIAFLVLALLAIFITAFKNIADKITKDQEPLIGMDSELESKITDAKLRDISSRSEALKSAQIELTKAHQKYQTYIQNKYSDKKPASNHTDSIKQGIAIAQYQKSNKNPYLDQEVLRIKKEFPKNVMNTQIPPRPRAQAQNSVQNMTNVQKAPTFKSPYIQRKENNESQALDTPKPYKKPDNLKFLESVTKIYEQSGREDLASGLKNSISRAKQSI